jgi:hypothetical protein
VSASGKVLLVSFGDGTRWEMPARPLAEERADYYATKVDGHEKGSPEWEAEVQHGLSDKYDLGDFVQNNRSWSDLAPHARMVSNPDAYDYGRAWDRAVVTLKDSGI